MKKVAGFLVLTLVFGVGVVASASHTYPNDPHWNRATVKYIDSVIGDWDQALINGSAKWNLPDLTEVKTKVVAGKSGARIRKRCPYENGQVRVCNFAYGTDGVWSPDVAGYAQFSYSLPDRHILKGRIRLNDTNTFPGGWDAVTVHEMGHTLGLVHRDPTHLTSCMTPTVTNAQTIPDQHDYDEVNDLHDTHGHAPEWRSQEAVGTYTSPAHDESYSEVRRGNVVHVTWTLRVPS